MFKTDKSAIKNFQRYLSTARLILGLSSEELANKFGVARPTLVNWCYPDRNMPMMSYVAFRYFLEDYASNTALYKEKDEVYMPISPRNCLKILFDGTDQEQKDILEMIVNRVARESGRCRGCRKNGIRIREEITKHVRYDYEKGLTLCWHSEDEFMEVS